MFDFLKQNQPGTGLQSCCVQLTAKQTDEKKNLSLGKPKEKLLIHKEQLHFFALSLRHVQKLHN